MTMTLSSKGRAEMALFEGSRAQLYDDKTGKTIARAADAVGFPTIGIGHLVKKTDTQYDRVTLTQAQIDSLFAADVKWAEDVINKQVIAGTPPVKLNQNQFDALVSFVYNVGPGSKGVKDGLINLRSGATSSILRNLRAGAFTAAANGLLDWTKSGGVVMGGLVKRRQAERALFLS